MGEAGNREDAAPYNYPHFDDHIAGGGDVTDEAAFRDSPWAGQRATSLASTPVTCSPASASRPAASSPPGPIPITTMPVSSTLMRFSSPIRLRPGGSGAT